MLRITGKHMDIGDVLRARIDVRVNEAVAKYFDGGFSGHVTVEKSPSARNGARFSADCAVHLDTGLTLQAAGDGSEATAAFDMAAERLEKRLRRYKRRLKSHAGGTAAEATEIPYRVVEAFADGEDDDDAPEELAPAIVAERTVALKTMSVAAAVVELDVSDAPVVVFRNPSGEGVSVVYRRSDGHIGWIDASAARNAARGS
ncbi:MAG TPA: ribosome-associated translation inhibitor RaiA [Mesorhizobium sp.]|nr:ribosome-associated translation inhibitor RaiA [Mesorhizobium sp.]